MDYVLNLGNKEHLEMVTRIPVKEVVIQARSFSLYGSISDIDLHDTLNILKLHGKRITLQWDTLCQDGEIESLANLFADYSKNIPAIRFVDPGVGAYLKRRFPDHQLQFLMWDGHQNRTGISEWIQIFQPNLQRVILSNQIPKRMIEKLRQDTKIPIEIKGLGRMQLFYSPRKLLHNNLPQKLDGHPDITTASNDRPSQFFSVKETRQGTAIFNDKDLYLLDELQEIQEIGVDYLGMELYTTEQYQLIEECFGRPGWVDEVKTFWKSPLTSGFFIQNKTDALLTRLTNAYLKDEKQYQLGSVLESLKNVHTLLHLSQNLVLPQQVVFVTPERKKVRFEITKLYDLKGILHQGKIDEGFYRLPWIKYVVPASLMKSNTSF
ncbi:MAG: hypothetical protein HN580_01990 [Deltaproteobacteria bacterium]|nr:hypothetical protein [Deltaproteobacteria bacterium]MBT4087071.1 hypothetical protein [Deltaproteobacteria bacterium]MBT4266280.1 hypothetical protein [Deltaproteobacteria bacterium]MBT4639990.1 hypothetical protein [Deltaproteobacteria bacterium]MBT6503822.1 hypothetical protein [Deltaproteobacteria bacterium]